MIPLMPLFSVGAGVRGGSSSPLAAELSAQITPLPLSRASASLAVTTQGDLSATLQGDAGIPGVATVGVGVNLDRDGIDNSFMFGKISPLELFTLLGRVNLSPLGETSFLFSGEISPLGLLSDAFALGTSIEIYSNREFPAIRIFGRIGGINFTYNEPDFNVGISIGF